MTSPESRRPRLRITSDGSKAGTVVQLVTKHGAVIDLNDIVTSITWSLDANDGSAVCSMQVVPTMDVEVLGELQDVLRVHEGT